MHDLQVELGHRILALCTPLVHASQLQQKRRAGGEQGSNGGWLAGSAVARLLRRCCEGRLLPTVWLNKVSTQAAAAHQLAEHQPLPTG